MKNELHLSPEQQSGASRLTFLLSLRREGKYHQNPVVAFDGKSHCVVIEVSIGLSPALTKDKCFLALHSLCGWSYPLVCLDRRTGNELWRADVWAVGNDTGCQGGLTEDVSLLRSGHNVLIVIGAGTHCFYIEGFDVITGKCLFRFANWYAAEVEDSN